MYCSEGHLLTVSDILSGMFESPNVDSVTRYEDFVYRSGTRTLVVTQTVRCYRYTWTSTRTFMEVQPNQNTVTSHGTSDDLPYTRVDTRNYL